MVVLRSHKTQSFDWDSAKTAKFYDSVYFVETLHFAFAWKLEVG